MSESLFLALNRFSLVAIDGFFHTLLLGLWGLWAGRHGLVFVLLAAQIFAPTRRAVWKKISNPDQFTFTH
jgi:hypothetical protein